MKNTLEVNLPPVHTKDIFTTSPIDNILDEQRAHDEVPNIQDVVFLEKATQVSFNINTHPTSPEKQEERTPTEQTATTHELMEVFSVRSLATCEKITPEHVEYITDTTPYEENAHTHIVEANGFYSYIKKDIKEEQPQEAVQVPPLQKEEGTAEENPPQAKTIDSQSSTYNDDMHTHTSFIDEVQAIQKKHLAQQQEIASAQEIPTPLQEQDDSTLHMLTEYTIDMTPSNMMIDLENYHIY